MEFYVNELSLHGQYKSEEIFIHNLKNFLSICNFIQEEKVSILADKTAIYVVKAWNEHTLSESISQISRKDFKEAFYRFFNNKLNPKDWRETQKHSVDDEYFCNISNKNVSNTSLAEISERKIQNESINRILISFDDSIYSNLTQFEITKNETTQITLNNCSNKQQLEEILDFNKNKNIYENSERFVKTSRNNKDSVIYLEKLTDYYWYEDKFHSTNIHHEVFDKNGNHVGEGNEKGVLDVSKKDNNKKIDI